jgi:O-antigen/teichoic acid export membrane protein
MSLELSLQAVGFVVGVALIRGLPKETYGQYAVYVGILFASILVSESGLSNVMLSHANRHGGDAGWSSDLLRSGLYVRRRIGLSSSLVGAGILGYLLSANNLPVVPTVIAVLAYLTSMQAVFVRSNCQVFLRLNGLATSSQKSLVFAACFRLAAVLGVLLAAPSSMHFAGIVLVTAATYWGESWLMIWNLKRLKLGPGSKNPLQIRRLGRAARRLAPMNLATVGREQAFLLIMSLVGSTIVLGEISAFTRFAIAFTLVNSFMLNLLLPRIARLEPNVALKTIPLYAGIYAGIAGGVVVLTYVFSPFLLWILGESYAGLDVELTIVMAGSSLLSFCSALAMMGQSRGWLGGAWVSMAGSIIWAASGPLIFDLHTTLGGAIYVGTQGAPVLLAEVVRFLGGIRSVRSPASRAGKG